MIWLQAFPCSGLDPVIKQAGASCIAYPSVEIIYMRLLDGLVRKSAFTAQREYWFFFHRILFRDKNLWIEAEGLEGSNQGTEGIHSVTCRNIKKIYLHLLFPIAITQFNYQASVTLFIRHRTLIEHLLFLIFLIPPRYFPSDEDEESEEGEEEWRKMPR